MSFFSSPKIETNGFAQKALIIVLGVFGTGLLGFFVWLATSVIEIKVGVAEMRKDINSLTAAQGIQGASSIESNSRRIDDLERKRR